MAINNKKIKFIIDVIINLAGVGIGLLVLHLIVYPLLGKQMDSDLYGQMQTIIAIVYMIGGTLGTSLSTTRLVEDYSYSEKKVKGDFNALLLFSLALSIIIMPVLLVVYIKDLDIIDIVLITTITFVNLAQNYVSVGFRIVINYKAIFISKIIGCIGYLVGYVLFLYLRRWEFVFLCSFLFEFLYSALKTGLLKETYSKTALFGTTTKAYTSYSLAGFMSRSLTYFDKLLLYPLLGGTAVSIYFAANVFGKIILMTIEPITNVILSYLSKRKSISKEVWKIVIPITVGLCAVLYVVCLFLSFPVLRLLYPQWAEEAIKLVPLTTLILSVSALSNVLYPFTLKALKASLQMVINGASTIIYVLLALLFYKDYGITGCCIGLLISYIVKLLLIFVFCKRGGASE